MSRRGVLLVGNFLSKSGKTQQVCESLAPRFAERGWDVVTASDRPGRLARAVDMAATTWRERRRYDVAYVELFGLLSFRWAEAVAWTLRRAGKPYVLAMHGGELPEFAAGRPDRVRRLLASADAVTAPSGYLRDQMRAYREDIRIIANGMEVGRYTGRVRTAPRPVLVWVRSFHAWYNPAMAARVVGRLVGEWPDIRIIMLGPDKGDGSLQRMHRTAEELGVSDRIETPGQVAKDEVPGWLDRADIFLNTTTIDNMPVSVLEAQAAGLCVISTNVGGVPYIVEDGHDGLLVPSDDAEAMAAAVRRVLTEPGLGERLSRNAREKAGQFDWSVVIPQWEALFESIMRR